MEATLAGLEPGENLSDVQAESLERIALFAAAAGYVWLVVLVWPVTRVDRPIPHWLGDLLLLVSATLTYVLRDRLLRADIGYAARRRLLRIASYVVVLGALAAVACATWASPSSGPSTPAAPGT